MGGVVLCVNKNTFNSKGYLLHTRECLTIYMPYRSGVEVLCTNLLVRKYFWINLKWVSSAVGIFF